MPRHEHTHAQTHTHTRTNTHTHTRTNTCKRSVTHHAALRRGNTGLALGRCDADAIDKDCGALTHDAVASAGAGRAAHDGREGDGDGSAGEILVCLRHEVGV